METSAFTAGGAGLGIIRRGPRSECTGSGPKSGQTMVEYIISVIVLMITIAILSVFLYTLREQNAKAMDFLASGLP
jgi:hypothetical protein